MARTKPLSVGIALLVLATAMSAPVRAAASQRTVTVYAASSLTKAYTALGDKFMKAHPQIAIKFSFGSSATLATQIAQGAPADIFAAADSASMQKVATIFPGATNYVVNQVVLALPKSSSITKFSDLNGKVAWLQCAHTVPCGIAADSALKSEGAVTSTPVSLEATASAATAKLLAGAVDAAILFKTDVLANSDKLKFIPFTNPSSALSQYQIGISSAPSTAKNVWAKTFYSYLSAHSAKKFLAAAGFIVTNP